MKNKIYRLFTLTLLLTMVSGIFGIIPVSAQDCPAATVADSMGLDAGASPMQYELAEFQEIADCTMTFSENPSIAEHNASINGDDADLPPVEERIPAEALVIVPQVEIGTYGGQLRGISKSPESGTSHFLSTRHVNLFKFHEDLVTIVPWVAKGWEYNDDFTELIITLREGHKWSDGAPFTTADILFWYDDLKSNTDYYENISTIWVFGGEPMVLEAIDDLTIKFSFAAPAPNFVTFMATTYIQPFQPKHFMSQFHPTYNPDADANAAALGDPGITGWTDLFKFYFHDWKDTYHPFDGPEGTHRVVPTLESHILVDESPEFRSYVANPYFFMVDTAGNQLPYYDEAYETYVEDPDLTVLKMINAEIDFKDQSVELPRFPELKQAELDQGGFRVFAVPTIGEYVYYTFNITHPDAEMAKIYGDLRFRQAMSIALNREEMNEIVYLGQGRPIQSTAIDPVSAPWITEESLTYLIDYDPDGANALLDEMGLTERDSEGFRLRFDGEPFIVLLQYAPQGGPVQIHELTGQYWQAVGVRVQVKEVTSDFYRTETSQNRHDLATWRHGWGITEVVGNTEGLVPPFGDFLDTKTGVQWAEWVESDGAEGIEPPEDILRLYDLASDFKSQPIGSDESARIGNEIVQIFQDNMIEIGMVGEIPSPVYISDRVGNFQEFAAKAYPFYWAYPYRPIQWFIQE